jgi:ribosomal protein L7/L12
VRRLPLDAPGPWVQEAKRQLAAGDKSAAIRVVREATGLALGDAKSIVDSWEA